MKVLIVSDTHGQDENLEETVLREAPFDYLIHCGDVEGREIFIEALAECPCTIVAGNNDFFTDLPYDEEVTLEDIRYWLHMDITILCPGIMINLLRMRRLRDVRLQCMVILTCL